mmetsp:Transcript_8779/g.21094  ORF Transcript_8779/g.21094 Transcript_8779/m.21094 type:complete len:248 (-) Transcript_8779:1192-1935(-)
MHSHVKVHTLCARKSRKKQGSFEHARFLKKQDAPFRISVTLQGGCKACGQNIHDVEVTLHALVHAERKIHGFLCNCQTVPCCKAPNGFCMRRKLYGLIKLVQTLQGQRTCFIISAFESGELLLRYASMAKFGGLAPFTFRIAKNLTRPTDTIKRDTLEILEAARVQFVEYFFHESVAQIVSLHVQLTDRFFHNGRCFYACALVRSFQGSRLRTKRRSGVRRVRLHSLVQRLLHALHVAGLCRRQHAF